MRFPKRKLIRAVEDYHVDRTEVEAQQCVELTVTNSPFGLTIKFYCRHRVAAAVLWVGPSIFISRKWTRMDANVCGGFARAGRIQNRFWVIVARGSHPFPSRTRKLSPSAPMVLHAPSVWESRTLPN